MTSEYSIKDLERLSGIKAHTIRIWEQRYELIKPKRTPTNIRYYEDCDLRKILNVSFLVHDGVKISQVASLSEDEMSELVLAKSLDKGDFSLETNALKMAMLEYNQNDFSQVFDECVSKYGIDKTFTDVLGSFIGQIGVLWQTETITITHEHFVSSLIKQKLYSAIDGVKFKPKKGAKTYLLYLPAEEYHEIGLLYLQFYLMNRGDRVVFLGQNTPSSYLAEVIVKTRIDEVISVFTSSPHSSKAEDYLTELDEKLKETSVKGRFCGWQLSDLMSKDYNNERFLLYKNLTELRLALE